MAFPTSIIKQIEEAGFTAQDHFQAGEPAMPGHLATMKLICEQAHRVRGATVEMLNAVDLEGLLAEKQGSLVLREGIIQGGTLRVRVAEDNSVHMDESKDDSMEWTRSYVVEIYDGSFQGGQESRAVKAGISFSRAPSGPILDSIVCVRKTYDDTPRGMKWNEREEIVIGQCFSGVGSWLQWMGTKWATPEGDGMFILGKGEWELYTGFDSHDVNLIKAAPFWELKKKIERSQRGAVVWSGPIIGRS